jgi:competence protein ComEC
MLYPGDMESRGWSELLKKKDFVSDLKTTCFLVASHHGREKGFSKEILDIAEPLLTIVSDSWFKDTSVTAWYSDLSYGFEVKNDNTGKKEQRKVISTRADGRIIIDVSDDGANTTADVRVKKTPVS